MPNTSLKSRIETLYTGRHRGAVLFRYSLMAFDLVTVIYFIATTPFANSSTHHVVHLALAVVIFLDLAARFWIEPAKLRYLFRIYVLADIAVLTSLVLAPFVGVNLAFLRILRGLRLGHSKYLLRDLRRDWLFFRVHEDAMVACLNLIVFIFVTAAGVFTFFAGVGAGMSGYLDAIYFTVTTLTTTGYGDITPATWQGKLVSIAIMIVGVSLFLNLARAIFTPGKVHHRCGGCGLTRHEPDAIHCKHCGAEVQIETKGFS